MPTLRKGGRASNLAARPGRPEILLESQSPYGSRRVVVEYDGVTSSAYLYDSAAVVAATWIANHQPAAHTKHPGGRPPFDPRTLRPLWFEEGYGVAVVEGGQLLAVIPGWCDMSKGMPGYSRDVIGQTPFGWSLDDAMEGLGPRADRATAFWRWRASEDAWGGFQKAVLGHLLGRLGPGARYWDVSAGKQPIAGVSERPPTRSRPFTVLTTIGMSCQRMPVIEQYAEDASSCARIELALATTMPSPEAARIFLWLAQYPWRAVTWFGPGHSIRWYHEPATFPLGGGNTAVRCSTSPPGCSGRRCLTCRGSPSAATR